MMTVEESEGLAEGERLRDEALERFEERKPTFLLKAKHVMANTLLERGNATADDVRDKIEVPEGESACALGVVPKTFSSRGIISRGASQPSRRPSAHAHHIAVWELEDREGLIRWLEENPLPSDAESNGETVSPSAN